MTIDPAVADLKPMQAIETIGPDATDAWPLDASRAYVERFTRRADENFTVLSGLVPEALRPDFASVYAFCRWADDLGDEVTPGNESAPLDERREKSLERLAWWRGQLDGVVEGRSSHPVFVALAETAARRGLGLGPFHRLIDAFERDQRQNRYATWDDLLSYCRDSADPVGEIVLTLGGVRPPDERPENRDAFERSAAACTALQLTNFWQDVRRDLTDRDRVYLPSDETGWSADDLRGAMDRPNDHVFRAGYIKTVRGLVDRTRELYERAAGLPDLVPPEIGRVVWVLVEGGRRTLERTERTGCTTLWKRPRLGLVSRAGILMRAKFRPARGRGRP